MSFWKKHYLFNIYAEDFVIHQKNNKTPTSLNGKLLRIQFLYYTLMKIILLQQDE